MGGSIDEELNSSNNNQFPKPRNDMKEIYFDFLKDFREYLVEYMRESVTELRAGEQLIKGQMLLFDGVSRGKVVLKNQGKLSCYISTSEVGGFRLDPGETESFFVNNKVYATTVSGSTSLGYIKY